MSGLQTQRRAGCSIQSPDADSVCRSSEISVSQEMIAEIHTQNYPHIAGGRGRW